MGRQFFSLSISIVHVYARYFRARDLCELHCLQLTQRETVRGRKDHAARRRRREIWTPSDT